MKRKFYGTKEELEEYLVRQKMPAKKVCEKFGVKKSCLLYWAKKLEVDAPCCGGRNIKNLTGKKFGKLTVIKQCDNDKTTHSKWLCKCDCGKTKEIIGISLRNGLTRSCGCLHRENCYKGYKLLSGQLWARIQKGAVKRHLDFVITIEEAWDLYEKQNRRCALTGVPIGLVTDYTNKHQKNTASLDRIDNLQGYVLDNIQWVHRIINKMKNKHNQKTFIEWCKKVTNYNE